MDNLTHSLTGLFLSRAGLNRFDPHATAILLISANIPDSDIVSLAGGSVSYLHWHRNLTHSLVCAPLLALATVLLVRLIRGPSSWFPAFLIALAGVASHLLLDLTNIYGVRLLLPFSAEWLHWDLTPVVDFWLWGMFLICIAGPFLSKLVGSEIGASAKASGSTRGFAVLALISLIGYNASRAVTHARAVGILESRVYNDAAPLRVAAFAASQNPLRWKGLVETDRAYQIFWLDILRPFDPALGDVVMKSEPSSDTEVATKTKVFGVLREFAVYPLYRLIPDADGNGDTRVELSDMRFPFTSIALVDRTRKVRQSWFQFSGASH